MDQQEMMQWMRCAWYRGPHQISQPVSGKVKTKFTSQLMQQRFGIGVSESLNQVW
jgi:hypothetical protein